MVDWSSRSATGSVCRTASASRVVIVSSPLYGSGPPPGWSLLAALPPSDSSSTRCTAAALPDHNARVLRDETFDELVMASQRGAHLLRLAFPEPCRIFHVGEQEGDG